MPGIRNAPSADAWFGAAALALAAVPSSAVVSPGHATAFLSVAAVLAFVGAVAEEGTDLLRRSLSATAAFLRSPVGSACLFLAVLAALSLARSPDPRGAGLEFAGVVCALVAGAVACSTLDGRMPGWASTAFPLGVALAGALVLADGSAGFGSENPAEQGRAAISVLLWPALAMAFSVRREWLGFVIAALALAAVETGPSPVWTVAAFAGAAGFALGMANPFLAFRLWLATVLSLVGMAPAKGDILTAANLFPGLPLESWISFGDMVGLRPGTGHGLGAAAASTAGGPAFPVPPYDGFLQVWVEMGAAGALILCLVLWSLGDAARRVEGFAPAGAMGALSAGAVLFSAGFGAWQGWWIAAVGVAAVWTWSDFPDEDSVPPEPASRLPGSRGFAT